MIPVLDRALAKVDPGDCWEWTAFTDEKGYGRINNRSGTTYAHRVVYEGLVGPIPEGLEIDHLCRNRSCVKPDHLEPVTHAENNRRGYATFIAAAKQLAKTHCKRGHEFTDENTAYTKENWRRCRTCHNERRRKQ